MGAGFGAINSSNDALMITGSTGYTLFGSANNFLIIIIVIIAIAALIVYGNKRRKWFIFILQANIWVS